MAAASLSLCLRDVALSTFVLLDVALCTVVLLEACVVAVKKEQALDAKNRTAETIK